MRVVYVNMHTVTVTDNGIPAIYGGKPNYSHHLFVLYDCMGTWLDNNIIENMSSDKVAQSPSQLPRVYMCVGPELGSQGRVNISWDPLPCHLQNGANIRDYIIQCTTLPGGQPKPIYSSTDSKVECHQEPGGPYSCLASSSFFLLHVTYSFQVAAQNSFGAGSFSTPVIYSSQGST